MKQGVCWIWVKKENTYRKIINIYKIDQSIYRKIRNIEMHIYVMCESGINLHLFHMTQCVCTKTPVGEAQDYPSQTVMP